MSNMFDHQIKHYIKKYNMVREKLKASVIIKSAAIDGLSRDELKQALLDNTKEFKTFVYRYARTLIPGNLVGSTYAAVVATLMDEFGLTGYICKSGFCVAKDDDQYERYLSEFNEMKAKGDEHPTFANNFYIEYAGKDYEYYNSHFSGIDHIDVITVEV